MQSYLEVDRKCHMQKKVIEISLITSFIVYPILFIGYFILNLFRNQSFNFFGFGLVISDLNQTVKVNLIIKPEFFITFIFVFIMSVALVSGLKYIKDRKEVKYL